MNRRDLLKYVSILPTTYIADRLAAISLPEVAVKKYPESRNFISSGFKELDTITGGFYPGELIILAGRPSMGKSACALNILLSASMAQKQKVAYFSIEMGKDQLMARLLALESGLNVSDIRIGKIESTDWPRLINSAANLSESQISVDYTASISPADLYQKCKKLKSEHGLNLIIVDYLQLMRLPGKTKSRSVAAAEISTALKTIAMSLDVPVIAIAQLNRSAEYRSNRRPVLTDLRQSYSIEQQADKVIFLYRENYYNQDSRNRSTEMIVAKNKIGKIGTATVLWQPNTPFVQESRI